MTDNSEITKEHLESCLTIEHYGDRVVLSMVSPRAIWGDASDETWSLLWSLQVFPFGLLDLLRTGTVVTIC